MLNKISLLSLSVLAAACVVETKDTGVEDTSTAEPAGEAAAEPAGEPSGEPAEEAYSGPLPDGSSWLSCRNGRHNQLRFILL